MNKKDLRYRHHHLEEEMINYFSESVLKFKKNLPQITPQSLLQQDLNLSSLEMISLITDLCEKFNIDITTISDVDLARMTRVIDVIDILASKR